MTLDRAVSLGTMLALILSGAYFVFRLEASFELLAQKLNTIDEKVEGHLINGSHEQTRATLSEVTTNIAKLHTISLHHAKELDRLRD